jgi:hypothetical protein
MNIRNIRNLRNLDKDHLLELIGLETKPNVAERVVAILGVFGLGFLAGSAFNAVWRSERRREVLGNIRNRIRERVHEFGSEERSSGEMGGQKPYGSV